MGSLEELEKYAEENNIPIMQKDGIKFLEEYIRKNNIKKILEIGSAIGYSAIKMALINKNIKITTIERDEKRYKEAIKNIEDFNLNNQIKIILKDALEMEVKGKYDLIFIDAAKAQNIKFFEKFKNNLNENGSIITDNLNFHGLTKEVENIKSKNLKALVKKINNYKEFLKNNEEFTSNFYETGDGISVS
ncbi:MAG: O-methyltransferase, partial [Bacilli bacterium]|nr:O-methyltransferase [Bacilli bacterium]